MKKIILLAIATLLFSCNHKSESAPQSKTAKDFFPKDKAQVLLVGTFHFNYPGLDAHQIKDENKIDVLTEPKKSEVSELIAYIKNFKPTKIAIEALPTWNATQKLRAYKEGVHRDNRDERYQIGMRLAAEIGLDTLYSIDSGTMADDIHIIDSLYSTNLWKDFDFKNDDPYNKLYTDWYKEKDQLAAEMNLLEYFKLINSRESHQYGYGAYLVGDFKLDNQRGADILSFWWYNRNVRIFRKLQQITQSPEDRILLIFGNGHAAVLRQLIEASPEYEFIEFSELLDSE